MGRAPSPPRKTPGLHGGRCPQQLLGLGRTRPGGWGWGDQANRTMVRHRERRAHGRIHQGPAGGHGKTEMRIFFFFRSERQKPRGNVSKSFWSERGKEGERMLFAPDPRMLRARDPLGAQGGNFKQKQTARRAANGRGHSPEGDVFQVGNGSPWTAGLWGGMEGGQSVCEARLSLEPRPGRHHDAQCPHRGGIRGRGVSCEFSVCLCLPDTRPGHRRLSPRLSEPECG